MVYFPCFSEGEKLTLKLRKLIAILVTNFYNNDNNKTRV